MRAPRTFLLAALTAALLAPVLVPASAAAPLGVTDKKEWKQLKGELAPALHGDDHEKRNRAIYKLGRADWPDAVKLLLKFVKQPDPKSDALVKRFDKLTAWIIPLEKKAMANGGKLPINEANNHRAYIAEQKEIRRALTAIAGLKRSIVDALGNARKSECVGLIMTALEKERDAVVRAHLLTALSQIPGDEAGAAIRASVTQDDSPYARAAAITALGAKQGKADLALLLGALDDEAWPVRAAAVDAIRALGPAALPAAVEPLIGMLEKETGRLKGDIADCLSHLCGQAIGPDAELWRSWYAANKEKLKARASADSFGEPLSGGKGEGHGTTASFYGIKTTSKKIAFVVDLSGSMNRNATAPKDAAGRPTGGTVTSGRAGKDSPPPEDPSMQPLPAEPTRLDVVKRELMKAIWGLPEDAIFALVGYHTEAQLMGRGIQKATSANKKAVGRMVAGWTADGGTNTYDALQLALALGQDQKRADKKFDEGVDTIFLLSDGLPSFGKVADPDEIVAAVVDQAKKRRVRIHTIWVGAPADGGGPNAGRANEMGERFMRELAEGTGGQFVKR